MSQRSRLVRRHKTPRQALLHSERGAETKRQGGGVGATWEIRVPPPGNPLKRREATGREGRGKAL